MFQRFISFKCLIRLDIITILLIYMNFYIETNRDVFCQNWFAVECGEQVSPLNFGFNYFQKASFLCKRLLVFVLANSIH